MPSSWCPSGPTCKPEKYWSNRPESIRLPLLSVSMIKAFRVRFSTVDFEEWECVVEFSHEDESNQTELEDKAKRASVKAIVEWWETLNQQELEGVAGARNFQIFALTDSELSQVGAQFVPVPIESGARVRITRAPSSFGSRFEP